MRTLTVRSESLGHLLHSSRLAALSTHSIALRLFVTCWLVYGLHFATNTVREVYLAGGLAGGAAVLFDYSGIVYLVGLCLYGFAKAWRGTSRGAAWRTSGWYVLGTLLPIGLLWFYQWKSFGNPFLPAQQWMTPTALSGLGYQGVTWPQPVRQRVPRAGSRPGADRRLT